MTPQQAILTLGAVTLTGCGGGLVLAGESNPLLKGLRWMGMALLAGALAASCLLAGSYFPFFEGLANLVVVCSLFCCYKADALLFGLSARLSCLNLTLLGCQLAVMLLEWTHLVSSDFAAAAVALFLAVQLIPLALLIYRHGDGEMRVAARLTVALMGLLIVGSVIRAGVIVLSVLRTPEAAANFELFFDSAFVAAGIGLGFTFFWRTTSRLGHELEHMASTDPLTRVFNRRVFLNWCENEQGRSLRLHTPFSVMMLDFDHFKSVNDTYGHHVGDEVLCAAVERIQDSIRGIDVLCRWGGEEFAILLPNASEEAMLIVAERVRRNIQLIRSAHPRLAEDAFDELQLSASLGTATFAGDNDTYQLMLQRADAALYEAKHAGRNRVIRSRWPRSPGEHDHEALALQSQEVALH